jgi:hypothetical protein
MFEAGDEVVLLSWRSAWEVGTVERVTPTLAIVGGNKFKRDTGACFGEPSKLRIGGKGRAITNIRSATPEWKEQVAQNVHAAEERAKKQNMRWELRGMCEKVIDSARDGSLSDDQVAAATKALKEVLGE